MAHCCKQFCFWGWGESSLSDTQTQKTKRTTFQSSVLHCDQAERDWLATALPMVAPLNAFPLCSPQGHLQAHCAKSGKPPTLFSHLRLQVNLRQRYKNKRHRCLDAFLLRGLAEREGFEPPEPRSSTVFKTAAIDHSATSPRDKSSTSFLIYQIFLEKNYNFFLRMLVKYLSINRMCEK